MEVFAVYWSQAYEGELLMGIFSGYFKAREYQLSQGDDVYIRKVVLDEIYQFGDCGEELLSIPDCRNH